MKQFIRNLIIVVVIVAVSFGMVFWKQGVPSSVVLADQTYSVEVARTPQERERGLSERESFCTDCAMLFMFEEPGRHSFWMKGMRFSLDILWLSEGKVIHIERGIPADSPRIFTPPEPVDRVLEVNAGRAEGVRLGDTVSWIYR